MECRKGEIKKEARKKYNKNETRSTSTKSIKQENNSKGKPNENISKMFPNFMALTEEERLAFFEALSAARKNVEKSGAPTRQRFGTVHDEYLTYFNESGKADSNKTESKNDYRRRLRESKPTSSEPEESLQSCLTLYENVNGSCISADFTEASGDDTEASRLSKSIRTDSLLVSESLKECESILKKERDQVVNIFIEKKKRIDMLDKDSRSFQTLDSEKSSEDRSLHFVKTEQSVSQSEGIPKLKNKENIKPRKEGFTVEPNKFKSTPKFDALNSEEKKIFFNILQEARDNILEKHPEKRSEMLSLGELLQKYDVYNLENNYTTMYSTAAVEKLKEIDLEGSKSLKLKLTVTSPDNTRIERARRAYKYGDDFSDDGSYDDERRRRYKKKDSFTSVVSGSYRLSRSRKNQKEEGSNESRFRAKPNESPTKMKKPAPVEKPPMEKEIEVNSEEKPSGDKKEDNANNKPEENEKKPKTEEENKQKAEDEKQNKPNETEEKKTEDQEKKEEGKSQHTTDAEQDKKDEEKLKALEEEEKKQKLLEEEEKRQREEAERKLKLEAESKQKERELREEYERLNKNTATNKKGKKGKELMGKLSGTFKKDKKKKDDDRMDVGVSEFEKKPTENVNALTGIKQNVDEKKKLFLSYEEMEEVTSGFKKQEEKKTKKEKRKSRENSKKKTKDLESKTSRKEKHSSKEKKTKKGKEPKETKSKSSKANKDTKVDKESKFDKEPKAEKADQEQKVDKEPQTNKESKADDEPKTNKESKADSESKENNGRRTTRETKTDKDPKPDKEPNADKETKGDNEPKADKETKADKEPKTDKETKVENESKPDDETKSKKQTKAEKKHKIGKKSKNTDEPKKKRSRSKSKSKKKKDQCNENSSFCGGEDVIIVPDEDFEIIKYSEPATCTEPWMNQRVNQSCCSALQSDEVSVNNMERQVNSNSTVAARSVDMCNESVSCLSESEEESAANTEGTSECRTSVAQSTSGSCSTDKKSMVGGPVYALENDDLKSAFSKASRNEEKIIEATTIISKEFRPRKSPVNYSRRGTHAVDTHHRNQYHHREHTTGTNLRDHTPDTYHKDHTTGTQLRERNLDRHQRDQTKGTYQRDHMMETHHKDQTTVTRHKNQCTDTQHKDQITDTHHKDQITDTHHKDQCTDTHHKDQTTDTHHRDQTTDTNHRDQTTETHHRDQTTDTHHRDQATDTHHRDQATETQHNDQITETRHKEVALEEHHKNPETFGEQNKEAGREIPRKSIVNESEAEQILNVTVSQHRLRKVVLVDDGVIEKIKRLIKDLEKKARSEENRLENQYLRMLLEYIEYLSTVLEKLVYAKNDKAQFQNFVTVAEAHLKFDDNPTSIQKVKKPKDKSAGAAPPAPRSISETELNPNPLAPGEEEKDSSKPKRSKLEAILENKTGSKFSLQSLSDSISDTVNSEELIAREAALISKQKQLPTTKVRLLQDLLKERAQFVEGSVVDFKIVHVPQKDRYVPTQKGSKAVELKTAEDEHEEKKSRWKFLKAVAKFCKCGKKETREEDNVLENLKGEAVAVDVTEDAGKNPASVTLNDSTMEVLKAAGRKQLIQKYYRST